LTPRAEAWTRNVTDFIGARGGVIPPGSIGLDGDTSHFLDGSGAARTPDYPVGANPSASVGLTAINGTAVTFMRSDATPSLNQAITPTWTGLHTFSGGVQTTSLTASTTIRSTGGFGCNGATPQVSAAVNAAIAGTAGAAYTATEQGLINNTAALVNQLRAALIANGIAV
jgi:hypothetical protein